MPWKSRRTPPDQLCSLRRSVDDPQAFRAFYDAYSERVLVFFTRRVLDVEVAMELTAETFAQALAGRRQFRGRTAEEEQGWLWSVARTQLGRYWRRGRVERAALERVGVEVPPLASEEIERVERLAGIDALRPHLRSALAELPDAQREAIELRTLRELEYAEIAETLAVSEDVVRARVSRGLRTLAEALRRAGVTQEDVA